MDAVKHSNDKNICHDLRNNFANLKLIGNVIKKFEERGLKLVAMKMCKPGEDHFRRHYNELQSGNASPRP